MSDDAFLQMLAGQSPGIFRGSGMPQSSGPFNLQTSNPLIGMLLQAVANPLLQGQASQHGLVPSQFLPTQNMSDQRLSAKYTADQQRILSQLSQLDQPTMQRAIQGGFRLFNQELPDEDARTMSKQATGIMPLLSQVIGADTIDALHGRRGSAAMMGLSLQRAGFHRLDSASGRMGQSADTIAALGEEIFASQFEDEDGLRKMKGMRAGQAGSLFEELSRRGIAGRSIGTAPLEEQIKSLVASPELTDAQVARMAKRTGETAETIRGERKTIQEQAAGLAGGGRLDMSKLDQLETMGEQLRMFDANRVGKKLEGLSGAVSAMRDVMGDMGHPNAPMSMLVAGLDALTQGGLTNLSPADAERMVRTTHGLAKRSGVSMEAVAGMTAQTAQQADRLGLDRSLVPGIVQRSLAFGGGADQTLSLDMPRFGAADREKLTLMDQQLRTNATSSPMANRLGALMRLGDNGLLEGPAKELYDKVAAGDTTVEAPKSDAEFTALMGKSGVGTSTARQSLRASFSNQEQIGKYGAVGDIVRGAQFEDLLKPVGSAVGSALTGDMIDQFKPEDRTAVKAEMGRAVVRAMHEAPSDVRNDPKQAQDLVAKTIIAQGAARGIRIEPKAAREAAVTAIGQMDTSARSSGFGSHTTMFDLMDKRALEQGQKFQAKADEDSRRRAEQAGEVPGSVFERISEAVQTFEPTGQGDEMKMLLKALGAVDVKDLQKTDPVLRSYAEQRIRQKTADQATDAGKAQFKDAESIIGGLQKGGDAADRALRAQKRKLKLTGLDVTTFSTTKEVLAEIDASSLPDAEKDRLRKTFQALDTTLEEGGGSQRLDAVDAIDKKAAGTGVKTTMKDTTRAKDTTRPVDTVKTAATTARPTKSADNNMRLTGTVKLTGLDTALLDLQTQNSGMMWIDGAAYLPDAVS